MSLLSRVVVTCRLENGDGVDVATQVKNRPFSASDIDEFRARVTREFSDLLEDTLYYKVRSRSGINGSNKKNWSRVLTLEELYDVLSEAMESDG